jgi:hypothetical protein
MRTSIGPLDETDMLLIADLAALRSRATLLSFGTRGTMNVLTRKALRDQTNLVLQKEVSA